MSQLNVDTIKNRLGTAGPIVPSLSVTSDVAVGGGGGATSNTGGGGGGSNGSDGSGIVIIAYPT